MKAKKISRLIFTTRLVGESNIFSAIGSILNIGGCNPFYNYSKTPIESDTDALASDWEVTGHDIRQAIKKIAY